MRIFVSYSTGDKKFLSEFLIALKGLRWIYPQIDVWDDSKIEVGLNVVESIKTALNAADIVVVLVSPQYIASPYLWDHEVPLYMEREARGECIVVPVIIRTTSLWMDSPLSRFTALPSGGRPVSKWSDRDGAWANIIEGLVSLIEGRVSGVDLDTRVILDNKPEPLSAAYRIKWVSDRIFAQPTEMNSHNIDISSMFLEEVLFKVRGLKSILYGTNSAAYLHGTIDRMLDVMPERIEELNPALLRSRARTMDNDLARYFTSDELSDEVKSRLGDVAGSTRDLLSCFPELREVEAAGLALDLQNLPPERLDAVAAAADAITESVAAPEAAAVVDVSVPEAMREMAAGADPERGWSPDAVRQLADRVLVTGNFLASFAIGSVVMAFDREYGVSEKWRSVRPALAKDVGDGLDGLNKPEVKAAITAAVWTLHGPVAGLAALGGSFLMANTLIGIAKRYLDKPDE